MMKTIITISAVFVAILSLTESVKPCDEGLIKKMAIQVCGIEKRSFKHIIDTDNNNTEDTMRVKRQFTVIETPGEITRKIPLDLEFQGPKIAKRSAKVQNIMDLVKECCTRVCTVEDFRDMCD